MPAAHREVVERTGEGVPCADRVTDHRHAFPPVRGAPAWGIRGRARSGHGRSRSPSPAICLRAHRTDHRHAQMFGPRPARSGRHCRRGVQAAVCPRLYRAQEVLCAVMLLEHRAAAVSPETRCGICTRRSAGMLLASAERQTAVRRDAVAGFQGGHARAHRFDHAAASLPRPEGRAACRGRER